MSAFHSNNNEGDLERELRDRPFAPIDIYWRDNMNNVQCRCCNSGNIQNNRFQNKSFFDAATSVLEKHRAGKGVHALGEAVAFVGLAFANRMRAEWKCETCGAVF